MHNRAWESHNIIKIATRQPILEHIQYVLKWEHLLDIEYGEEYGMLYELPPLCVRGRGGKIGTGLPIAPDVSIVWFLINCDEFCNEVAEPQDLGEVIFN